MRHQLYAFTPAPALVLLILLGSHYVRPRVTSEPGLSNRGGHDSDRPPPISRKGTGTKRKKSYDN